MPVILLWVITVLGLAVFAYGWHGANRDLSMSLVCWLLVSAIGLVLFWGGVTRLLDRRAAKSADDIAWAEFIDKGMIHDKGSGGESLFFCKFDNTPVAGHYVQASKIHSGKCSDAGWYWPKDGRDPIGKVNGPDGLIFSSRFARVNINFADRGRIDASTKTESYISNHPSGSPWCCCSPLLPRN